MKNLALLFLFLNLFMACKQKEEKLPVNPEQWLSQIKNEEAKKRTTDVLEKIYVSTVYSVAEKDSLSSFQVQVANCQTPKSVEHFVYIFRYLHSYTNNESMSGRENTVMKYISNLYQKDSSVNKAALSSMIDTTKIDFGRYFPPYYSPYNDSITNPQNPSKNLVEIENELIKYMKVLPSNSSQEQADSIGKIHVLLKKAIKDSTFFDYGLPNVAKDLYYLASADKKFVIYSIYYQRGSNSKSATAYAAYRNQQKDKTIIEEISGFTFDDEDSYGESAAPLALFQVEKNKKSLYIIISDHDGGGMEDTNVIVKAYQIEDNKIQLCKDCIEGKSTGIYQKSPHFAWVVPAFDSTKNEITFNHRRFYGNIKKIDYNEQRELRKNKEGSGEIMSRMTLKWNGQQFISIPLKLYCEE
ncbi:hypothetical protein [Bernardetia sp. MNP-M8]|uniref:hypothetical protein n=1 Tax=Bernardetia sp. MNP-M8 TaxID=3127470 RepID=UPI0030CE2569